MKTTHYYHDLACEDDLKSEPFSQILLRKWLACLPKDLKVLDFGTGLGANLASLIKLGFKNIYACDISQIAVNSVRKKYPSVKLKRLNNLSLPYPDRSFDLILATEVLEHIPGYRQTLKEFNRLLGKNGRLIVTSPNYLNLTGLIKLYHDFIVGEKTWNPWKKHQGGFENLLTPISFTPYLPCFKIIGSAGLDFYFGWLYWLPARFLRFRKYFLFFPGSLPFFKYFCMNYCLFLRKC